jgi:amidohydrolase
VSGLDRDLADALFARLDEQLPAAYELRRRLHSDPRVSGDESDTLDAVLAELGLPAERVSGGAVVLVGPEGRPTVALRAELDGLPVVEQTTVEWRSRNGAMHACGHDVHLAAAVAVARAVQAGPAPAPLLLALQPREERTPSGAVDLISSEELQRHDVVGFVAVHVQPQIPRGEAAANPGPVNAAADDVHITVYGRPGHGAYPHTTADSVLAAADLVGALHHVVSRQVDPMHPTVLTIAAINGGESTNVVPPEVRIAGTLRTFDEADRDRLATVIESTARAVTGIHGCTAEVQIVRGEPVLRNNDSLARATHPWLERAGLVPTAELRSCGADDFSYYGARYPSLMIFLGVGGGDDQPGLHHPKFLPSEDDVAAVARAMLAGYLGSCDSQTTRGQIPMLQTSNGTHDLQHGGAR